MVIIYREAMVVYLLVKHVRIKIDLIGFELTDR